MAELSERRVQRETNQDLQRSRDYEEDSRLKKRDEMRVVDRQVDGCSGWKGMEPLR
jgi:hypothetical protein